MINAEFIQETDALIERVKEREIQLENGNMLVAKVRVDTKTAGGLFLSDDAVKLKEYHSGFGRILALPNNLGLAEGDAKLRVGDYIIFTHESRYRVFEEAIREVLGSVVEKDTIFAVQDSEVILHISKEKICLQ